MPVAELCTVDLRLLLTMAATCLLVGCTDQSKVKTSITGRGPSAASHTEVRWSNGVRHGPARIALPDGSTKEGLYASGLKEGIWVWRSSTGDTLGTTAYATGKLHGWSVERKEDVAVREAHYAHGVANGPRITRYTDGHPASLVWFIDGQEHGTAWRWNQRDTVNIGKRTVGQYVHGVAQGTWRRYYANGVLNVENDYVNGVRHGHSKLWGPDGTLLRHLEYRNDVVVRTIVDKVPS